MFHWLKFNAVGALGFALQAGMLFLLTHVAHPFSYLAATAAAVELAVLNNFVWHQRWTWSNRPSATLGETLGRLAKFNITNGLVSIAGNLVLMSILVGRLGLPIVGANLVSVVVCSICNFFLADRIAFPVRSRTSARGPQRGSPAVGEKRGNGKQVFRVQPLGCSYGKKQAKKLELNTPVL